MASILGTINKTDPLASMQGVELNPETDTVEGRLNNLSTNSTLLRQSETQGNEIANRAGLMNSGKAIRTVQDQFFKNATPIAAQDATTSANAKTFNVGQNNTAVLQQLQGNQNLAQIGAQGEEQRKNIALTGDQERQTGAANISQETLSKAKLINTQNAADLSLASQKSASDIKLQGLISQHQLLLNTNNQAANALSASTDRINQILADANIPLESKQSLIDQVQNGLAAQLKVIQDGQKATLTVLTPASTNALSGNSQSIVNTAFSDQFAGQKAQGNDAFQTAALDTAVAKGATVDEVIAAAKTLIPGATNNQIAEAVSRLGYKYDADGKLVKA